MVEATCAHVLDETRERWSAQFFVQQGDDPAESKGWRARAIPKPEAQA
jgi:hypothetical protein